MKRPWLCIAAAMMLGEAAAYVSGKMWLIMTVVSVTVLIGVVFVIYKKVTDKRRAVIIMCIAFLFGIFRLKAFDCSLSVPAALEELSDTGVQGKYTAAVDSIEIRPERTVIRCGELIVYADPVKENAVLPGNIISVSGKFNSIPVPTNPGKYNFRLYYLSDGITHRCFADSITVTDDRSDPVLSFLYIVRSNILAHISSIYDSDDAGILRAALLGDKSLLDDELYNLYKENGIAHLLAISGLHVGILGLSIYRILRERLKLSYVACALISSVFISAYSILSGNSVSTVRAVIMLIIIFAAGILGRKSDIMNSAGIASFCILCIHPYELFNCGFMLSFSAVIAIGGPARLIIKELGIKNSLLQALAVSFSVQLTTLPITAYFFFEISLYGLLLNLIVLPLMTYVVWSGIAAVLLSYIYVPAAYIAAGSSHYILNIYTLLCRFTGKLPFSTIITGRPALWQIVVYYCFFFAVLYFSRSDIRDRKSPLLMSDKATEST